MCTTVPGVHLGESAASLCHLHLQGGDQLIKAIKNPLVPVAIPLQPRAVQGQETSRSDWPPDGRSQDSIPCPYWRRLRSGHQVAGQTAGPAGLNMEHLEWKAERAKINLTFTSGGRGWWRHFCNDLTYTCTVTHIPTWELLSFTAGLQYWLLSIKTKH